MNKRALFFTTAIAWSILSFFIPLVSRPVEGSPAAEISHARGYELLTGANLPWSFLVIVILAYPLIVAVPVAFLRKPFRVHSCFILAIVAVLFPLALYCAYLFIELVEMWLDFLSDLLSGILESLAGPDPNTETANTAQADFTLFTPWAWSIMVTNSVLAVSLLLACFRPGGRAGSFFREREAV
ncbi:MAG TPA: hypothetical protein VFU15_16715 [Bacteroidia bacterium]|nr:hypothetical protein [Bacteroidia bacterium]